MISSAAPIELDGLESAARRAAAERARTGQEQDLGPKPSLHHAPSEADVVAAVLRHRLGLTPDTSIGAYDDLNHALLPGTHLKALRLQVSNGARRRYIFLASYDADAALVFSLIGRCTQCAGPVPTIRIDSQADFGDWLLDSRDQRESPLFSTSPVHRSGCDHRSG